MARKVSASSKRLLSLRPFFWVAGLYGGLGLLYFIYQAMEQPLVAQQNPDWRPLWMFVLLWLCCLLNLFSLARLIQILFAWNRADRPAEKAILVFPMFFWGSFKFGFLGIIGSLIYLFGRIGPGTPLVDSAILVGVNTLAIVPLIGGLSWSIRLRA